MYSKKSEVNSNCEPESADLNTNLCRKGKTCSLFLRKPLSGISFPLCLSSHVSCFLCGLGSVQQWQREEGAEEGDSPSLLASLLPAPLPSRSRRKMSAFLLMLQQRCPSCSFRANSWAPTWGPLCFALIIMPQPVTLMGKGQAPRQTGGEISQHPLPALGILSHLENAKKNKKRK